jgi:signal transduction histidine kinase
MAEGLSASETEHAVQREIAELQARLDEAQSRLRAIKLAASPNSSPAPSVTCESYNEILSYN